MPETRIPYVINTNSGSKGWDYYHTIFEFTTEVAGSQLTIVPENVADGLVAYFGGPGDARCWFLCMGLERSLLVLDKQVIELLIETRSGCLCSCEDPVPMAALELVQALCAQGFAAERDYLTASLALSISRLDTFKSQNSYHLVKAKWKVARWLLRIIIIEEITVSLDQTQETISLFLKIRF